MAFAEYAEYDMLGLAELIARGEVSAADVLEAAIERIEALNPAVNAVVYRMDEEARRRLEAAPAATPLRGVPFLLKDLGVFYEGFPVSNACRLYDGFVAEHDSTIVERLRRAGVVIVGKTNTSELALDVVTEPVMFGPTRNPWNLNHGAGGSSGGSAAAVACRMVAAAHGSDNGGSLRSPASSCGVFGLKPSRGRVPNGPSAPGGQDTGEGWSSTNVNHALTRSVRDSAALLDATAGPVPGDQVSAPPPRRPYLLEVGADPGRLRIGLNTTSPFGADVHPECLAAVHRVAESCTDLGHHVEEAVPEINGEHMAWALTVTVGAALHNVISDRLETLGRQPREGEIERISGLWAEAGTRNSAADFARGAAILGGIGSSIAAFFETYDLMLSPTLIEPPLPIGALSQMGDDLERYIADVYENVSFLPPFNLAGHPAASLPLHWTPDGLPIGVQLGARYGAEDVLVRVCSQLEQALPWADKRPSLSA
jgi:amidase/6-aminohexanoate-cyclic-dimer hydrolase